MSARMHMCRGGHLFRCTCLICLRDRDPRTTLALCVSNSSVHFSPYCVQHLHWNVLCVSFSGTLPSSRHVRVGCQVLLQYLAHSTFKSSAQKKNRHPSKKDHHPVSIPLAHKTVAFVKFLERVDVVSELFGPWGGVDCESPFVRHAMEICPHVFAQKLPPTLAGQKGRPSDLVSQSSCPAHAANSELHCTWH